MHPDSGLHTSIVQAFASSQDLAMCSHPVAGSHRSIVHGFWSSQLTPCCPTQTRWFALHMKWSPLVQASPSSQGAPSFDTCVQTPDVEEQESVVHSFPSSQFTAGTCWHAPVY
jgi:hypothetical protein